MSTEPTSVAEFVAQGRQIVGHGELVCGLSVTQIPQFEGNCLILVKSKSGNVGAVHLGNSDSVTASTGSTNTTAGLELVSTEYLPLSDTSSSWIIGTDAADGITYLVLR